MWAEHVFKQHDHNIGKSYVNQPRCGGGYGNRGLCIVSRWMDLSCVRVHSTELVNFLEMFVKLELELAE